MTDESNAPAPAEGEDTSAVLAALEGDKTYLEPKTETAPAAEAEEEDPGEDPAATEGDAAPDKRKMTAKERVQQAVARQREAEREVEFWKAKAIQPSQPQPAQVAQPHDDGRPNPADYEGGIYDPAYVDAQIDWRADQAVQRRLSEREARETVTTRLSTFQSRADELFPDGEPEGLKAFRAEPSVPEPIAEVILASDIGPKIAEHLGDNPREFQRISGLSPALQARELTLLETRLAPPAKPSPNRTTSAPEPPPQARGAGGQFKVSADTDDFAAFEKQYRAGG